MNINVDIGNYHKNWLNVDPLSLSPIGGGKDDTDSYNLPCDGKAEVIEIRRIFERLKDGRHKFLIDLRKSLADNGFIYLCAFDYKATMDKTFGDVDETRVVKFGPHWRSGSNWLQEYKIAEIVQIFEEYGFEYFASHNVDCEYPSHKLAFHKANLTPPVEYVLGGRWIDSQYNTVDIGPGNHPWKQAKNYIEHPSRLTDPRYGSENMPKVNVFFGDLQKGLPEIKDKQFDFAWASHIFEHLDDPIAGAKELSRIARQGIVVVPSAYKDAMCYWEENEHKWDIFPGIFNKNPRFVQRNQEWLSHLKDQEMSAIFGKFYREPKYDTREERYVKNFYWKHKGEYDIVIEWKNKFEIEVC